MKESGSMKEPRFLYVSDCCKSPASKPACVKSVSAPKKKGKKGGHEKATEFSTLGHWSCSQCGKSCKVSVHPRPPKEEKAAHGRI